MKSSRFNGEEFQKFFQDNTQGCLDVYLRPQKIWIGAKCENYKYGFAISDDRGMIFENKSTFFYLQDAAKRLGEFLTAIINFMETAELGPSAKAAIANATIKLNQNMVEKMVKDFGEKMIFLPPETTNLWNGFYGTLLSSQNF